MFTLAKLSALPAYKALPRPPVYFSQKFLQERVEKKTLANGTVVTYRTGKKGVFPPKGWSELTETTIVDGDKVLCLQTGHRSGVTIYDIDTQQGYDLLVALNPELKDVYTVKTHKGYHLYFQYDPTINTCDNVANDEVYGAIDTRNDGGFVFCPPTTYLWDGKQTGYEYLGGEVKPFPQCLKDTLSERGFKQAVSPIKQAGGAGGATAGSSVLSPIRPSSAAMDTEERENVVLSPSELMLGNLALDWDRDSGLGYLTHEEEDDDYAELVVMIESGGLDVQAAQGDFDSWYMIAAGLSNSYPDDRGYELLDLFSRRNPDKYDPDNNRRIWESLLSSAAPGPRRTKKTLWWLANQNGYVPGGDHDMSTDSVFSFTVPEEDTTIVTQPGPPTFKVDHRWDNAEMCPELPGDLESFQRLMNKEPTVTELAWEIAERSRKYVRVVNHAGHSEVFFWHDGVWHQQGEDGLYNAIYVYGITFRRVVDERLRPEVDENGTLTQMKQARALQAKFDKRKSVYNRKMFEETKSLYATLKSHMADPNFFRNLDRNPWICNFKNCVVDFECGIVRPGRPEDMCAMSTGSNYIQPGSPEDTPEFRALQDEVMGIFEQIIPGEDERRYFLEVLAARFIGINRDQVLYFGIGPACNGKSLISSLCSHIFGSYMGQVPKDVFMGKQKAGAATSELANLKGCRIVFASEPSSKDVLNESLAKQFTGDDTISVRQLYCEAFNMKVMFCVFFMTNHLIAIPADGNGIWRRLKVLPFTSLFTDDVETAQQHYTEGEVFPINKDLKDRLPALRDAATTLLVNICLRIRGVVKPNETVERESLAYRYSQDQIKQFLDAKIILQPGHRTEVSELRQASTVWSRDGLDKKMDLQTIIDRLQQSPYNCLFDQDRKVGEGFMIKYNVKPYEGEAAAPVVMVSPEEIFLEKFDECHKFTGKDTDYIVISDIKRWAILNGMPIKAAGIMKQLIKNKYESRGLKEVSRRVPVANKTGNHSRDVFVGIKRRFWRSDGAEPAEDVIAKDLNASIASDKSDEV